MSGVEHLVEFVNWLSTKCGVGIGSVLFVNAAPETTGLGLFLIEEQGLPPHLLQSTSYIRKPRFRIHSRSTAPTSTQGDYPDITAARNLAQSAWQACLDVADTNMIGSTGSTGSHWLFATPESEPFLAGRDEKNRVVFGFGVGCELNSRST